MSGRAVERRIVTVLFADLVGFTSLSERLDPEDVALLQDAYFDAVRDTIDRHGGVVEKFVGDAVMAAFGATRARDDDAERAVRAGLALVTAVERLNESLGFEAGALRLRVGVNSGETIVGEATVDRGPVTGDAVNVAARLQTAAEPGAVVVGELTALAVDGAVELDALVPLDLKGKAQPVRAWRVVAIHASPSRERALGTLRAPLVGRDAELRRLLGRLGDGARRVVVAAPPGVGKTRLLDELERSAAPGGACVFRARLRPDLLSPFEPVGQLVRSAGDPSRAAARLIEAGASPARAAVVRDALASVVAPVAGGGAASDEREQLFAAWLEGLDALAGERPALWLVEDLHWASGDLLAFLDRCGRAASAAGRLVVGTTRPTLLETAAEWCAGGELLELPPLPEAQTATLVRALVGDVLPGGVVDQIADRSGGNALFVEELLRTWASTGVLVPGRDGGWTLTVDAQDVVLPATVQAIYAGQLDDLPPAARRAARRASVAGRRFPVASFAALEIEDGAAAIETLVRRSLVGGPTGDPVLGDSYAYRHALLRDAGYASLARGERAALHLRLADWLAGLAPDALPTLAEVIARHYAAAVENAPTLAPGIEGKGRDEVGEQAAGWFERASEVASRFAAWESARALALRAVELTAGASPGARGRRLERLAEATANAVGLEPAEMLLREALDVHRAAASREGVATAGAALGRLLRAQTRFAAAEALANDLLDEVGPPDDRSVALLVLLRGRAVLNAWDDYERAHADAALALGIARAAGDAALELEALELAAEVASERGELDEESWVEIEQLAREAGEWAKVAGAIRTRAFRHLDDAPDDALPLVDDAAAICDAYGLVESGGWCDYLRAEIHFSAGRWDDAIACGLRAIELGEAYDYHRVVVRSWFVLLPIARARGLDELAAQAFPRFDSRRGREPDSHYARIVTVATHLHLAAAGLEPAFVPDLDERAPSFDLDHVVPSWLAAVEAVVGSALDAGRLDQVERALDLVRARLGRGGSTRLARATEALLRARLLLARERPDEAWSEARRAAALVAGGSPWCRAKAIRLLERAGAASSAELEEARGLERALGLV